MAKGITHQQPAIHGLHLHQRHQLHQLRPLRWQLARPRLMAEHQRCQLLRLQGLLPAQPPPPTLLTTPVHPVLQHRVEHKPIAHAELTLLRAAVAEASEGADLRIQQLMLAKQHGGIGSQPAL